MYLVIRMDRMQKLLREYISQTGFAVCNCVTCGPEFFLLTSLTVVTLGSTEEYAPMYLSTVCGWFQFLSIIRGPVCNVYLFYHML
jgi:hypothetical protein